MTTNGTTGNDNAGGNDTVTGGTGNDVFLMGRDFTQADSIDGGGGAENEVVIDGLYPELELTPSTMKNIQLLHITGEHAVYVDIDAGTVPTGGNLDVIVDDSRYIVVDVDEDSDATYEFSGGSGHDVLRGGAGNDTVVLQGGAPLVFNNHTLLNIENLTLDDVSTSGYRYEITTSDKTVYSGATLTIDASSLQISNALAFNGSAETKAHFAFTGGAGGDVLIGGGASDSFDMSLGGNDTVTGGGGADSFTLAGHMATLVYNAVADSTSVNHDVVSGLVFGQDHLQIDALGALPTAIDAEITGASVSAASFDADIKAAANAHQLGAHHAVEVAASGGDLAGHVFLIVDENGAAGYQGGHDLVIDITGATGTLATSRFT
jgi:Ca2+-binding RTX toxin-like protein